MENTNPTPAETGNTQELPKTTLLSAISYQSREDYEIFLNTMTGEHAVVTLIAAANHAQVRGAYNLDEAELIARAIRKLTVDPAAKTTEAATQGEPAKAEAATQEEPAKAESAPKKSGRSRKA
jgi:hypothetical protein